MNEEVNKYLELVDSMDERPMTDEEIDEIIYGGLYEDIDDDEVSSDDTVEDEIVDVEDVHRAGPGERGGLYGLVHENGTPCDAQTPESCPEEKAQVEADLLGVGKKKRTADMMTREEALHEKEYLKALKEYWNAKYHERFWFKKNPGENVFLNPHNKAVAAAFAKMKKAKEDEEDKWTKMALRGENKVAEWYDEKMRKHISKWSKDGHWMTLWDRMDPKEIESIKRDNQVKSKKNRGHKATSEQHLIHNVRYRAKKLGVSYDNYVKYLQQYKDEKGIKYLTDEGKGFRKWLTDNGIPLYGKPDISAARRYVEMTKADSVPGVRHDETTAGKLAKLGIDPAKLAALADMAKKAYASGDGGNGSGGESRQSTEFGRNIALEMKRRNAG